MNDKFVNFTVAAETPAMKDAFVQFIDNYKDTITGYLNSVPSEPGMKIDASIEVKDGVITVFQIAPNKGFILGETAEGSDLPVKLMDYKELPVGLKYLLPKEGKMALFLKTEEGKPDVQLGMFLSMNDSVKEFHSQSVKDALKRYNDHQKALKKEEERTKNRLRRLGKLPAESDAITDAEIVEEVKK